MVVDETERRKVDARVVMTATDSQMGHDPVGAMMAKYDKDQNGTFDVHECAAGTARALASPVADAHLGVLVLPRPHLEPPSWGAHYMSASGGPGGDSDVACTAVLLE